MKSGKRGMEIRYGAGFCESHFESESRSILILETNNMVTKNMLVRLVNSVFDSFFSCNLVCRIRR